MLMIQQFWTGEVELSWSLPIVLFLSIFGGVVCSFVLFCLFCSISNKVTVLLEYKQKIKMKNIN